MSKIRALPLVMPSDELRGVAPPAFERAAARARPGDDAHHGLIHICSAVALSAITSCAPPGARAPVLNALEIVEAWTRGRLNESTINRARADLFTALVAVERTTADAVRASMSGSGRDRSNASPLDSHADGIAVRYAVLGAHYAASTAVLTLDVVSSPRQACLVPSQAAGALAYRTVGLGAARSAELREKATAHAEWEQDRAGAPPGHGPEALAIQLFHEYRGALWKDQSDAQRVYLFDFVEWALPPELRAS